jgi:site-specific DNA-methyltransferase (adenine-specific)
VTAAAVPIPTTEVPGAVLHCGDALDVLRSLPDSSIDLIATDPPYYRVKGLAWDRAWNTADGFLAWIGQLADEWQRVLKPNGSLYCFASPKMAARVEVEIGKRFEVLTRITWRKPPYSTKAEMFRKEDLRAFFPASEGIIFAEHYGADNAAKGESGYGAECDKLRGFVFEPLRAYLESERKQAGLTREDVRAYFAAKLGTKGKISGHFYDKSQWMLPTEEMYQWLRECHNPETLRREYEDLRREYEDLRLEYETLRRPFSVTADVPYTDVWDFKTVPHRPGKHVCEKPLDLCEHIILASSRPCAVVLDSFCGSGAFGHAAVKHGRTFIGSDNDPHWIAKSAERIAAVNRAPRPPAQPTLFPAKAMTAKRPTPKPAVERGLFDAIAAE